MSHLLKTQRLIANYPTYGYKVPNLLVQNTQHMGTKYPTYGYSSISLKPDKWVQ